MPPDTGIVHQVNLEYLARVVHGRRRRRRTCAYPDTLVGTDSHTTMINGLGVLGWGVGGIEAEAAMLGQPISMLIPQVVGFTLTGTLPEGATATDLVLRVTEMLRAQAAWSASSSSSTARASPALPLADRATIANMCPGVRRHLRLLPGRRGDAPLPALHRPRRRERVALVEAYMKEQGLFHTADTPEAELHRRARARPRRPSSRASPGPKRPQDRIPLASQAASETRCPR